MNELQYDDFGELNGNRFFDDGGRARQLACSWIPHAVGNRPIDWATRDLVLGGAQRDRRNWALRLLIKNRHPQFFVDTYRMSERQRNCVCRARSFLFFHYLKLLTVKRLATPQFEAPLDRLLSCCPNLYQVERSPQHRALRACKQNKLCPFCLARTASRVAQQICHSTTGDSMFLLVSVQKQIPSLSEGRQSIVATYRRQFSALLRKFADDNGAEAGVFTFQVGPHSEEVPKFQHGDICGTQCRESFNLRAAVLFEVSQDSFCDQEGLETGAVKSIPAFHSLIDHGFAPEVVTEMNDGRDAIRSLVFGESPGNDNAPTRSGHAGVFAYQQWHLASTSQWEQYIESTQGLRLFNYWGNWVSTQPRPTGTRLTPASSRRGRYRQRQALVVANSQRKLVADDHATELVRRLEPFVSAYHAEFQKWPGWTTIRKIADEESISVSQRQARRIARQFQTCEQEQ